MLFPCQRGQAAKTRFWRTDAARRRMNRLLAFTAPVTTITGRVSTSRLSSYPTRVAHTIAV